MQQIYAKTNALEMNLILLVDFHSQLNVLSEDDIYQA